MATATSRLVEALHEVFRARAEEPETHRDALAAAAEAGVHWVANPVDLMKNTRDGGVLPAKAVFIVRAVEFVHHTNAKHVHLFAICVDTTMPGPRTRCFAATTSDLRGELATRGDDGPARELLSRAPFSLDLPPPSRAREPFVFGTRPA